MILKRVSTSLFLMASLLADTTCAFALPTAKSISVKNKTMIEIIPDFTSEPACPLHSLVDNPEAVQQLEVIVAANLVTSDQVFVQLIQLLVRLLHVHPIMDKN